MRDFVFAGTTILTETKGEQLFEMYHQGVHCQLGNTTEKINPKFYRLNDWEYL